MKNDQSTLRSGALASLAGVSTDTLRYYERLGAPSAAAARCQRISSLSAGRGAARARRAAGARRGLHGRGPGPRPQTARRGRRALPRGTSSIARARLAELDQRIAAADSALRDQLRPRRRPVGGSGSPSRHAGRRAASLDELGTEPAARGRRPHRRPVKRVRP